MTTKPALIEALKTAAGINDAQAEAVYQVYREVRAIKVTAHDGIVIAHGGFLDKPVILRALEQAAT